MQTCSSKFRLRYTIYHVNPKTKVSVATGYSLSVVNNLSIQKFRLSVPTFKNSRYQNFN